MKIGIDPPWYDNPVERTAFNLYAMNETYKQAEIDEWLTEVIYGGKEPLLDFSFDLTSGDIDYIMNKLADAGFDATIEWAD